MALTDELVLPAGDGPFPCLVIGAEAYGVNTFIRDVQQRLAAEGYASVVPDYYHGDGPKNPEDYEDFTEVIGYIERLDFTRATRDLTAAVDAVRTDPRVDPGRVGLWGYCTGSTLAWLATCMRGDVAATLLYFPSQPVFASHGPTTPVDPIDLLWQVTSPMLILYGDQDTVMPPERLAELRRRVQTWGVDVEVRLYPGGGHSFTAPTGFMRHEPSDTAAWTDALAFLAKHLAP